MAFPALGDQYIYGAIQSADDAAHDPAASDLVTIVVDIAVADWSPAADVVLAQKWNTTGDQRSWRFLLKTTGALSLEVSTDGTAGTVVTETSNANLSALEAGARQMVAATLDTADGDVIFQSGATIPTLAALGATQSGAGATLPFAGTAPLEFGVADTPLFQGDLRIDLVPVAAPTAADVKQYEDSYRDAYGVLWAQAGSRIKFSKMYPTQAVGLQVPQDAQVEPVSITLPEVSIRINQLDLTPVVGDNPGLYPS